MRKVIRAGCAKRSDLLIGGVRMIMFVSANYGHINRMA